MDLREIGANGARVVSALIEALLALCSRSARASDGSPFCRTRVPQTPLHGVGGGSPAAGDDGAPFGGYPVYAHGAWRLASAGGWRSSGGGGVNAGYTRRLVLCVTRTLEVRATTRAGSEPTREFTAGGERGPQCGGGGDDAGQRGDAFDDVRRRHRVAQVGEELLAAYPRAERRRANEPCAPAPAAAAACAGAPTCGGGAKHARRATERAEGEAGEAASDEVGRGEPEMKRRWRGARIRIL